MSPAEIVSVVDRSACRSPTNQAKHLPPADLIAVISQHCDLQHFLDNIDIRSQFLTCFVVGWLIYKRREAIVLVL